MKELMKLSREVRGNTHPETLRAINNYVNALIDRERFSEAEPLCKELLELRRAVQGPYHRDTLIALNTHANLLVGLGRETEAEPLMKEALELTRQFLGTETLDTIQVLSNYACILDHLGRVSESAPFFKELVPLTSRVLGPDHPESLSALQDYVASLNKLGRREEAQTLINERRNAHNPIPRLQLVGPRDAHPTLASSSPGQYSVRVKTAPETPGSEASGQEVETKPVGIQRFRIRIKSSRLRYLAMFAALTRSLRNALSGFRRRFLHLFVKRKRGSRALQASSLDGQSLQQRYHETERLKNVLMLNRVSLGPEHPDTLQALISYANALVEIGHKAEAEPFLKEALEISRRVLGRTHPDTLMVSAKYAEVRGEGFLHRLLGILLRVRRLR